jgi:hypothetical protein
MVVVLLHKKYDCLNLLDCQLINVLLVGHGCPASILVLVHGFTMTGEASWRYPTTMNSGIDQSLFALSPLWIETSVAPELPIYMEFNSWKLRSFFFQAVVFSQSIDYKTSKRQKRAKELRSGFTASSVVTMGLLQLTGYLLPAILLAAVPVSGKQVFAHYMVSLALAIWPYARNKKLSPS